MSFDTQDLPSYYSGYDDYCDTSKPVYSVDDWYEWQSELEEKERKIDNLLDKLSWIKDRVEEIKNKNYIATIEDIKYIEEIIEEED